MFQNNHLKKICMTYFQHLRFSSNLGIQLWIGSVKAFIHAIMPQYYITSTSDLVKKLDIEMKSAGCKENKEII